MSTRLQTTKTANPLQISLLWFGIQLAWGAVLGLSLQARSFDLNHVHPLELFGRVAAAGAFAAAVAQLVVGPISDRMRRNGDKRIAFYAVGSGIAAMALIAFYIAPTEPTFFIAFVVLQLAMNVVIGPYQAIIPDFVPKERIGIASGWMAAMQSAGNAAGAVAVAVLGSSAIVASVIAVILIGCLTLTIRHIRSQPLQPIAEHLVG